MTQPTTDAIGNQLAQPDPRGWLVFDHLPSDLQNAEDGRQYADIEKAHELHWASWSRNATDAERVLLAHLGYTLPPTLFTRVTMLTNNVRRRTWPALELQTPQPQGE